MTDNTLMILREARGYIAQGWNRLVEAEDEDGRAVWYNSPRAVSFGAMGALRRAEAYLRAINKLPSWGDVFMDASLRRASRALARTADGGGTSSVSAHNDFWIKNQSEALAWFDRAILVQVLLEEKETQ